MGAYIINVPSTVDRIIYVHAMADETHIHSEAVRNLTPYTEPEPHAEVLRKMKETDNG